MILESLLAPMAAWQTYYQIIGTAAATLTGLMFIVVTLIASRRVQRQTSGSGITLYSTPSVVHYAVALLLATIFNAPWPVLWPVSLVLCLIGLGGSAYVCTLFRQFRRRKAIYQPVLEDWLWHTVLPLSVYVSLIGAALLLLFVPFPGMTLSAVASMLLLLIGIHNAWDNVTYMILNPR